MRPRSLRRCPKAKLNIWPHESGRITQTEKRKCALVQDRQGNHQDRVDHQQRHDQRQDVMANDMPIPCADGACPQHELARLYCQRLRTDDACRSRPAEHADHKDDVEQARLRQRHDDDDQWQVRNDQHHVRKTHEGIIDPSAIETGHDANKPPMTIEMNVRRNQRSKKRVPRKQTRKDILAGIIGSKPVLRGGGL